MQVHTIGTAYRNELHFGVYKLGNEITKSHKITWFLRKTSFSLNAKCCCVKNFVTCLWMFWHEIEGKTEEKLSDSLQLIEPPKYSTFFGHCLKTHIATGSVFHRWQPVAHASYQPQNAAVWKCSRPRTSEFAISAGIFSQEFAIFLRSFAQQLKTTLLDSPHGSSVVSLQLESLTL